MAESRKDVVAQVAAVGGPFRSADVVPGLPYRHPLAEGDAVRFTAIGGQRVTATTPAEVLVWEMHATLGG